ncbi:hypothetical protein HOP50_02g14610 [Chloropicon primus]|uniref:Uncharacterized protein n=1 Tax=Chloropicon primus TaxID=1764295 RepID=A0A5B8MGY5_9CHLO|nr:hypothetical protein A3770_02p14730 [Chloropicon primus]UPQ98163.1 hypothetical protein HOP50_02g14610 [Chloropicon primus]|eukprot:QDZ18955.1 hypothetical protein A3770_02p14730 [Chloropicon primus]
MEEMDSRQVIDLLEDILASGLAIKPVNRIRVKLEKFIPFWEHMKEEETATYFAEVILRRLREIDNELESLPHKKSQAGGDKVMQPSFNPSPAKQQRFILQGPVANQTDRATRSHYTKANFINLLNKPLISLANSSTTLEYHLLRLRQTLLNTFFVLSIFHRVDCSDASLYSAIANMTLSKQGLGEEDSVTLLQVLGNFIIGQALSRESVGPRLRDYKDLVRCPFMHQDMGGHLGADMLDNAIRLFVEHMPKFGQVSGYHHMNFGYGMYLMYMGIRDACSVAGPETSPFVMISNILRQDDEELADQSLCCLFMLMKEFLCLHVVPSNVLMEALQILLPYRIWPLPVGNLASSLVTAIAKELKFPGYHVRKSLGKLVSYLLQSKKDNKNIQMCRVFLNTDSYQGGMFNETLKRYVKYREAILGTFGKDELIYSCFRLSLISAMSSNEVMDFDTAIKILRGGIKDESLRLPEIQRELVKIEETACDFPTAEKAAAYRSEALKKLVEEATKELNPSNEKMISDIDMVPDFGPSFTVHEITNMHTSNYIEVLEGTSGASGPKERRYPNSDAGVQLHKILMDLSANSPSKSRFQGFGSPKTLQIVIAGGDGTLHNFLKGYVHVHANYYDLIQKCGIEFKIYVLPLGVANRLSSFIAYYDSWYCGTVFTSLGNDLPLVPSAEMFTQVPAAAKEEKVTHTIHHRMTMVLNKLKDYTLDGTSGLTPMSSRSGRKTHSNGNANGDGKSNVDALKSIKADSIPSANICGHVLERYIDVAEQKLMVSTFVCEAWALQGKKTMHYTIPFCTQAYIGLPVHLAAFGDKNIFQQLIHEHILHQHSEGDPRPINPPENCAQAFDQALQKYRLEVSLSFTQVDLQGNEVTKSVMSPAQGFTSISLFNVPRSTDSGRVCDPRSEWLDVSIAEYEAVYKSRKRIKCFDDLAFCQMYHTNKLQVETLERHQAFSILLDGEIYGPFYRVRITPCKIPQMRGETLKLPVMHHLPFQM